VAQSATTARSWTRGDVLSILSVLSVLVALIFFCTVGKGAGLPLALGLAFAFLRLWRSDGSPPASFLLSQLSYLYSLISVGCLVFAAWNVFLHPGPRWVHRFVIYSGYSATLGTLATLAQHLARRFPDRVPWSRIGFLFLAIFALSSLCIYIVRQIAVRRHGPQAIQERERAGGARAARMARSARPVSAFDEPAREPAVPMSMSDVYRRFLNDELAFEEAAALLREHAASWRTEPGSLSLDHWPAAQREKAGELFSAAIQPILAPYFAGQLDSDAAARQLAPLVFPVGLYALNVDTPAGPSADAAMARLVELIGKLADLESQASGRFGPSLTEAEASLARE
jgi:hypothetical protein